MKFALYLNVWNHVWLLALTQLQEAREGHSLLARLDKRSFHLIATLLQVCTCKVNQASEIGELLEKVR